MAMRNPYNYSLPKEALKLKTNIITNNQNNNGTLQVNSTTNTVKNKFDQYKEQKILTSRPEELTLMLYEGIIKFLKQAKIFIEQKDIEKSHNALVRAQDIIMELNITLNMDYEISKNLRSLYEFMKDRLVEANLKKDIAMIDDVIELSEGLRDAWKQAMTQALSK